MIGSKLGAYEITAKLGEGGMGEVWPEQAKRVAVDKRADIWVVSLG